MIYTVTFNPSLDYIVSVKDFRTGIVNRTAKELIYPGGKGINVSIVLNNLGQDSVALGFTAGFTGKQIEQMLSDRKINHRFIQVQEGLSRINLKIRSKQESEINGQGPKIRQEDIRALYEQLNMLQKGDILVLAGSIPSVMPSTAYRDICSYLSDRDVRIVVDATRDLLVNVLEYHPFLIKPNNYELGEIFGVTLNTRDEVIPYAKQLLDKGAENVLVSMAGEGAVLVTGDGEVYEAEAPQGEVLNSVGAGDSMVAGFLAGFMTGVMNETETRKRYEYAFHMGLCTGSASAFSEELATKEEVDHLMEVHHYK